MKFKIFLLAALAVGITSCCSKEGKVKLIKASQFEKEIDGKLATIYTLKNANGMVVQATNYGARVVSLWVPDKDAKFRDVVLGRNSIEEYLASNEKFYGATIGRYGNRIANGRFEIDGSSYELDINDGQNHLHGGPKGFYQVVWDAKTYKTEEGEDAVEFQYLAPNGENGYPGNLTVQVRYVLGNNNQLRIYYHAESDATTIVNLTHHSYFNLNGEGSGTIEDHMLMINADSITPVDRTLIPTGEIVPVEGTPFDFRKSTRIGERINEDNEQLKIAGGYDHNWVINRNGGVAVAAELYSPESGIVMTVETDEPGIQFYSGNFINGTDVGKSGKPYNFRGALCLETQGFPDSPNHPNFPSTTLLPGESFNSVCYYTFSVKK